LFQFALTELFDRRSDENLTAATYAEMGGVQGAITRRAEELYVALDPDEQQAAKQLFLRLVAITDTDAWSRRRVAASEIVALSVDVVAMQTVLDRFGTHRLLTFDRDQATGSPTVEVAHEALLHEWVRLHDWIHDGRDDVINRARLSGAIDEWSASGEKTDYLLRGERLERYEGWSHVSTLSLNANEERFIDASVARRQTQREAEDQVAARVSRLDRQARIRLWGLAFAGVILAVVGVAFLLALAGGNAPRVAIVHSGADDRGMNDLMIDGLATAEREFDIDTEQVIPLVDPAEHIRHLAENGTDLIIVASEYDRYVGKIAEDYPSVSFVAIDPFALHTELDNIAEVHFAVEESAFIAGAAAAKMTTTGIVAFIGGAQIPRAEASRTGFEQGALFEDANVEVMSSYIGPVEDPLATAAAQPDLVEALATDLFASGADIVFVATGGSIAGAIDAAVELSTPTRQLWVIGSDINEYHTVGPVERGHVLSSAIKRYDTAVAETIDDFLAGEFTPGKTTLALGDDGVGLSRTGDHLTDVSGQLANLEGDVAFGHIFVQNLAQRSPMWQLPSDTTWQITIDDQQCAIEGGSEPSALGVVHVAPGQILEFEYTNLTDEVAGFALRSIPSGVSLAELVEEAKSGIPESFQTILAASFVAPGATTSVAMVMTQASVVPNCFLPSAAQRPSDYIPIVLNPTATGG
jgi:basic membrane lipoprotein Med (substrate-binding protein (PBP1-ABC) superfamily)